MLTHSIKLIYTGRPDVFILYICRVSINDFICCEVHFCKVNFGSNLIIAEINNNNIISIEKMSDSSNDNFLKSVIHILFFASASILYSSFTRVDEKTKSKSSEVKKVDVAKLRPSLSNPDVVYSYEHERRMNDRLMEESSGQGSDELERTKVCVRVPATSANLGPGFDAIGMAVDMWSEYTIERSDKFEVICEGEGSHDMPLDETNLVCSALKAAFEKAGKPVPILRYRLVNRIPYARGLGSSSAAIVGGLVAGFVLAGHRVPTWGSEELLNLAANIEGSIISL